MVVDGGGVRWLWVVVVGGSGWQWLVVVVVVVMLYQLKLCVAEVVLGLYSMTRKFRCWRKN